MVQFFEMSKEKAGTIALTVVVGVTIGLAINWVMDSPARKAGRTWISVQASINSVKGQDYAGIDDAKVASLGGFDGMDSNGNQWFLPYDRSTACKVRFAGIDGHTFTAKFPCLPWDACLKVTGGLIDTYGGAITSLSINGRTYLQPFRRDEVMETCVDRGIENVIVIDSK